jgi:mono/diheme cytochrome c family protein
MMTRARLMRWWMTMALLLLPAMAPAGEAHEQGRALYLRYCSACHGENGKGDGIVSQLMRPPPTDLTQLAQRAGGQFRSREIAKTIDGRQTVRAHGDPNMPVWGEILTAEGPEMAKENAARTKVAQITAYLESIQAK